MSDKESDKDVRKHTVAPGRGVTWRPLSTSERRAQGHRCAAKGLQLGDCGMSRVRDSAYCYYHDKLRRGEIEGHLAKNSVGAYYDVRPSTLYPVWPLPVQGYVLLEQEAAA